MWFSLLRIRRDNPIFDQARRRLRRRWWRSWVAPSLGFVALFYGLMLALHFSDWLAGAAAGGGARIPPERILRILLLFLMPLQGVTGFLAGARALQRERENGTLPALLMTNLSNHDLLAGKLLGTALPFVLFTLTLVPATLLWGWTPPGDLPSVLSNQWSWVSLLVGFWYFTPLESLILGFIAALLGIAFGFRRAATHSSAARVYGLGPFEFMLLMPFLLACLAQLFVALLDLGLALVGLLIDPADPLDFGFFRPLLRIVGVVAGAWLISLMPLCELAENLRFYCGDETGAPTAGGFRARRLSAGHTRPAPWTGQAREGAPATRGSTPQTRALEVWSDYDRRQSGRARPGSALRRRDDGGFFSDGAPPPSSSGE